MRHLFFTDLDGTLLDHDTYSYAGAMEGIATIRERGESLVLVSSKTISEMKLIHDELALDSPLVFENGGGIFWPEGEGRVEYQGQSAGQLRLYRAILETCTGGPVRFIDEMNIDEIVRLTGLSPAGAAMARERHASLPFITGVPPDMEKINAVLSEHEAAVTRGGRFLHLISTGADKGIAVMKIIEYYRDRSAEPITSIGIGDSENDISMLMAVDLPFLVRKPDGSAIVTGIESVRRTDGIGPRGFTDAVRSVLRNR